MHPKPAAVTLPFDNLLYDDDNRLSTWNSQTVTFDADGNMTTGPLPSGTLSAYAYDSRNRLTSAAGSNYRYSPDGLRVEITTSAGASAAASGAATFVIDPNAALSRTLMRTKGGAITYYVYGLGLLYEDYDPHNLNRLERSWLNQYAAIHGCRPILNKMDSSVG